MQATTPEFKEYQHTVVANSKAFAAALIARGCVCVCVCVLSMPLLRVVLDPSTPTSTLPPSPHPHRPTPPPASLQALCSYRLLHPLDWGLHRPEPVRRFVPFVERPGLMTPRVFVCCGAATSLYLVAPTTTWSW